jgi:hypothetical protein
MKSPYIVSHFGGKDKAAGIEVGTRAVAALPVVVRESMVCCRRGKERRVKGEVDALRRLG